MSRLSKDTARKLNSSILPVRDESFRNLSEADKKAERSEDEATGLELGWQAIQGVQYSGIDELGNRIIDVDSHDNLELVAQFDWRNICHRVHETLADVDDILYPDSRVFAIQLIVDDKYKPEVDLMTAHEEWVARANPDEEAPLDVCRLNRSTEIRREVDGKKGDLDEMWAVRAYPSTKDFNDGRTTDYHETTDPSPDARVGVNTDPIGDEWESLDRFKLMHLINVRADMEDGWVSDVDPAGFGLAKRNDLHVARPPKHIAQWGDVFVLTDDDLITTTLDGDVHTLLNIWHDVHFHMKADYDGRIYFTKTAPGKASTGLPVIGEMVGDPTVANTDTELNKESVNWRPQHPHPYPPDQQIVPPRDGDYAFPTFRLVDDSCKMAAVFPHTGSTKKGWSGDIQLPDKHGDYNLGIYLEYSAVSEGFSTGAVFRLKYKVVSPNEDESLATTGVLIEREITLAVPIGAETTLRAGWFPIINSSELAAGDMILVDIFYRDYNDVSDTLSGDCLIAGWKVCYTDQVPEDVGAPI